MSNTPSLLITDQDHQRLESLLMALNTNTEHPLEGELERANIVLQKDIPEDIVTMNSRIRYISEDDQKESELTLVYPQDADVENGKISVLAPIGTALFGLRVGQEIQWPMPNGKSRKIRVLAVTYQPEAAGDINL